MSVWNKGARTHVVAFRPASELGRSPDSSHPSQVPPVGQAAVHVRRLHRAPHDRHPPRPGVLLRRAADYGVLRALLCPRHRGPEVPAGLRADSPLRDQRAPVADGARARRGGAFLGDSRRGGAFALGAGVIGSEPRVGSWATAARRNAVTSHPCHDPAPGPLVTIPRPQIFHQIMTGIYFLQARPPGRGFGARGSGRGGVLDREFAHGTHNTHAHAPKRARCRTCLPAT